MAAANAPPRFVRGGACVEDAGDGSGRERGEDTGCDAYAAEVGVRCHKDACRAACEGGDESEGSVGGLAGTPRDGKAGGVGVAGRLCSLEVLHDGEDDGPVVGLQTSAQRERAVGGAPPDRSGEAAQVGLIFWSGPHGHRAPEPDVGAAGQAERGERPRRGPRRGEDGGSVIAGLRVAEVGLGKRAWAVVGGTREEVGCCGHEDGEVPVVTARSGEGRGEARVYGGDLLGERGGAGRELSERDGLARSLLRGRRCPRLGEPDRGGRSEAEAVGGTVNRDDACAGELDGSLPRVVAEPGDDGVPPADGGCT